MALFLPFARAVGSEPAPITLGNGKLSLPAGFVAEEYPGRVLGVDYKLKLSNGVTSIFVLEFGFSGPVEDAAGSFWKNFMAPRLQLRELSYISGTPRKVKLKMAGAEMIYNLYLVSLNNTNAFLVFIAPIGNLSDNTDELERMSHTVDGIISSYTLD